MSRWLLDLLKIENEFYFDIHLLFCYAKGWRKSGVNHVLIFELDPRHHLTEQHLLELAAILGVLWTLSILAFLYR